MMVPKPVLCMHGFRHSPALHWTLAADHLEFELDRKWQCPCQLSWVPKFQDTGAMRETFEQGFDEERLTVAIGVACMCPARMVVVVQLPDRHRLVPVLHDGDPHLLSYGVGHRIPEVPLLIGHIVSC